MAIEIRNTRDLARGNDFRLKILLVGKSRTGKTTFASTAPNPGVAACETGHGAGQLSVVGAGVDYFVPTSIEDLDALASGHVFRDKETIVLDSLSAMNRTLIKEYVLAMPRRGMTTPKRQAGVPELDDYGVMAEVTRRILDAILDLPKHVIVTALEKTEKDQEGAPLYCGPDLPGQMFLAAPAMFDLVLYAKTRKAFRDPRDPKSVYTQYYFVTQNDGFHIGGDRNNVNGKPILQREEIFDPDNKRGTFPDIYGKLLKAYSLAQGAARP